MATDIAAMATDEDCGKRGEISAGCYRRAHIGEVIDGRCAFAGKATMADCPHPVGGANYGQRIAWLCGWLDARTETKTYWSK